MQQEAGLEVSRATIRQREADIQLADGSSGLEAVNEMLESFQVPVVFITAYPERLLTGERPEPAFLITKPFDGVTVRAVASQALFFEQNAHAAHTTTSSTSTMRRSSCRRSSVTAAHS